MTRRILTTTLALTLMPTSTKTKPDPEADLNPHPSTYNCSLLKERPGGMQSITVTYTSPSAEVMTAVQGELRAVSGVKMVF